MTAAARRIVSFLLGRLIGLVLASAGSAAALRAQEPLGHEVGIGAIGTVASRSFIGGGVSFGLRPGGRVRVVAQVAPGVRSDGVFAVRGELLTHFMLAPGRARGVGFYGIGGIAGITGGGSGGYLVLGVGLESNPAGASGWLLEAGVGGGARLAVGWRHRSLHWPRRGG